MLSFALCIIKIFYEMANGYRQMEPILHGTIFVHFYKEAKENLELRLVRNLLNIKTLFL